MLRLLERATGLLVIAPPQRVRVRLLGSPQVPAGASPPRSNGSLPAPHLTPLARAPWGEPARTSPYVVITTQAWPQEWWRKAPARAAATVAARPITVVPARWAAAESPLPPEVADAGRAPAVGSSAAPSDLASPTASMAASVPAMTPLALDHPGRATASGAAAVHDTTLSRQRARSQRGLAGRIAILLLGLLVSVVATETAVRIGRR